MLMQDFQIQLVRPPVTVTGATACGVVERAFGFGHICSYLGRFFAKPVGAALVAMTPELATA
jgi:hypothetical protein